MMKSPRTIAILIGLVALLTWAYACRQMQVVPSASSEHQKTDCVELIRNTKDVEKLDRITQQLTAQACHPAALVEYLSVLPNEENNVLGRLKVGLVLDLMAQEPSTFPMIRKEDLLKAINRFPDERVRAETLSKWARLIPEFHLED